MVLTAKQAEKRQQNLGSSDIAALFGVDPYSTSYDVWLEKTGRAEPPAENDAMRAGTVFERGVLEWAREGDAKHEPLGDLTQRGCERRANDLPILVHIDAIRKKDRCPVEVKTSGLFGPLHPDWGLEFTDQVPLRVLVQCHAHMMAMNGEHPEGCHVPTFLGGHGFAYFHVPRNDQIIARIGETVDQFWNGHVIADLPPDDSTPSIEVLKRVRRQPDKAVEVDPSLHQAFETARQARLEAEKEEKAAKAALWAALGEAKAGDIGDDKKWYESREYTSETVDKKALKRDLPAVFEQYVKRGTYQQLMFVKKPTGA